jgi:hypothetical protein
MGSWGCPHEIDERCQKVNQVACDPGMKGCVLAGRFVFSNPAKNSPVQPKAAPVKKASAKRPEASDRG